MKYMLRINQQLVALDDATLDALYEIIADAVVMDEIHVGKGQGYVGYERSYTYEFLGTFADKGICAPATAMTDTQFETYKELARLAKQA